MNPDCKLKSRGWLEVKDTLKNIVQSAKERRETFKKATELLPIRNIWVNPDYDLKTRGWPEVKEGLSNMINSAKELREAFKETTV